jgi:hypothetical protein
LGFQTTESFEITVSFSTNMSDVLKISSKSSSDKTGKLAFQDEMEPVFIVHFPLYEVL